MSTNEKKERLATLLDQMGKYHEIEDPVANRYRARAYHRAAETVREWKGPLPSSLDELKKINGIGESISTHIHQFLETGTITKWEELHEQFGRPIEQDQAKRAVLDYFSSFHGIGEETAKKLYDEGYRTLSDIWFKAKLTAAQRTGIMWRDHLRLRVDRSEMILIEQLFQSQLTPLGLTWNLVGSYRRGEPTSRDIDLLVKGGTWSLDQIVTKLRPFLPADLSQGPVKYMGIFRLSAQTNGHQIDIRIVPAASYVYALMHSTGSERFNTLMRVEAIKRGLTLSEYGLVGKEDPSISLLAAREEDIFAHLGVRYYSPAERRRDLTQLEPA